MIFDENIDVVRQLLYLKAVLFAWLGLTMPFWIVLPTAQALADSCRGAFAKLLADSQQNPALLARRLVKRLESMQDQLFSKAGHGTYQGQIEALDKMEIPPGPRRVYDALQKNELEFTMIVPSSVRNSLPTQGFKNQHQSMTSGGYIGTKGRTAVEASYSGMSFEEFAKLPDSVKPKYGYLRPRLNSGISSGHWEHYGDDIFTFKKEKLSDRVTFTIGDSLNAISRKDSLAYWTQGKVHPAASWDEVYIPWSRRKLLTYFTGIEKSSPYLPPLFRISETKLETRALNGAKALSRTMNDRSYVELQFWGELNLDQVETFTFTGRPPSGRFLQELKARDIRIFDGRSGNSLSDRFNEAVVKPWDAAKDSLADFKLGPSEVRSSTGAQWVTDPNGTRWLIKKDVAHEELQTSAEVISSRIYEHLGYKVPENEKRVLDGTPYVFSKDIGKPGRASSLSEFNNSKMRQLRIFAAYLKDWDRIANPHNNFVLPDGSVILLDFGGTLGSRARGQFKPGPVKSEAIGALESGTENSRIYESFQVQSSAGHPWMQLTKSDMKEAIRGLKSLNDGSLSVIVNQAKFFRPEDAKLMLDLLVSRRDSLIAELQAIISK